MDWCQESWSASGAQCCASSRASRSASGWAGWSRMLYVGSRYPAEVKRGACIYAPILDGHGEPLDGITLGFCVNRRCHPCGWRDPRTKMVQSCRGPTKQVRTHCAACLQRTKWLCRGFDDILAPRLSGSGSYRCWCGGSGEGGPPPWPVGPKSTPCRICPAATETWEWNSLNACWIKSHQLHYRFVSAKSSLHRLGLWKL